MRRATLAAFIIQLLNILLKPFEGKSTSYTVFHDRLFHHTKAFHGLRNLVSAVGNLGGGFDRFPEMLG